MVFEYSELKDWLDNIFSLTNYSMLQQPTLNNNSQ